MAKALGEPEVADLLDHNLKQEKEALRTVEKIGRRLSKASAKNGRPARSPRRRTTARRTARAASRS